jgi:translation initiation factor 5A
MDPGSLTGYFHNLPEGRSMTRASNQWPARVTMAMGHDIDGALEYLWTLELDEAILSFLCDELVDRNMSERRELLEPYLEIEDLNHIMTLLPAECVEAQANTRKQCDKASWGVAEGSASHKAVEEKQEVQHIMEEGRAQLSTEQVSTARQSGLSSVLEFKKGGTVAQETGVSGCNVTGTDAQEERFQEAGSIKKGEYVMIKDQPCRIMQLEKTSKIWKGPHRGCFQTHIIARGIFTGKKEDIFLPVTQKVTMPFFKREECTVIDIGNHGELSLLTAECDIREDVNLPTGTESDAELATRIQAGFDADETVVVVVLSACGCSKVVECKIINAEGKLSCNRQR